MKYHFNQQQKKSIWVYVNISSSQQYYWYVSICDMCLWTCWILKFIDMYVLLVQATVADSKSSWCLRGHHIAECLSVFFFIRVSIDSAPSNHLLYFIIIFILYHPRWLFIYMNCVQWSAVHTHTLESNKLLSRKTFIDLTNYILWCSLI